MRLGGRLVAGAWAGLLLCVSHGWIPILALFAPLPLFWALRGADLRAAFYVGLVCGLGETLVVAGIVYAGVPLYVGMCLTYALARVTFTMAFVLLRADRFRWYGLVGASLWAVVEWGHANVPYSAPSILGNTQHVGPFLPLARVGGAYLISFCIIWLSAALYLGVKRYRADKNLLLAVRPWTAAVCVIMVLRVAASIWEPQPSGAMKVTIVQGGLPTWLYSRAEEEPSWSQVPLDVYRHLTQKAERSHWTVWPETAVWRLWGRDAEYERELKELATLRGAMTVGVPYTDAGGAWLNGAVTLQSSAPPQLSDKRRLALLAEHRFTPGNRLPLVDIAVADQKVRRAGVVFCLETVVPQYATELASAGAEVLVVLAEGSRFGQTQVGRMHAQYSVLRAVEAGRSVIHAGQHGFSTLIQPSGARAIPLPAFRAASMTGDVEVGHSTTPFVWLGHWALVPQLGLVLAALLVRLRKRDEKT